MGGGLGAAILNYIVQRKKIDLEKVIDTRTIEKEKWDQIWQNFEKEIKLHDD